MFIRERSLRNGQKTLQILRSVRDGKKVKQVVLRSFSCIDREEDFASTLKIANSVLEELKNGTQEHLDLITNLASSRNQKKNPVPFNSNEESEDSVVVKNLQNKQIINEGFSDIFGGLFDQMGFADALKKAGMNSDYVDIIRSLVAARISDPQSKRRTHQQLIDNFYTKYPLHSIYRSLDALWKCEENIKEHIQIQTQSLLDTEVDVLFFDVTTLYFESTDEDFLRKFGFSKDCKFNQTQVVLALICTTKGLPLSYEFFPGNTSEGKTLITCMELLQKKFHVKNVVLVADRAMFSENNLKLMEEKNYRYIVAAKLKSLSKIKKDEILNSQKFKPALIADSHFYWVNQFDLNNRRLIVSYSSSRAKKDAFDRSQLVERSLKIFNNKKTGSLDKLINNKGSRKFIKIESKGSATIDQNKIDEHAMWDGFHGVITNQTDKTASEILSRYKDLWIIEDCFRLHKHNLSIRPVYHHNSKRIAAHINLCFICFSLIRFALLKIEKKSGLQISIQSLQDELWKIFSTLTTDTSTKRTYKIPSELSETQKIIYKSFGFSRDQKVLRIT